MEIDAIPVDVISRIFRFLPVAQLPSVACVSGTFREAFESDLLWKDLYTSEIGVCNEDSITSWKSQFETDRALQHCVGV
jgi:hypothetical protein